MDELIKSEVIPHSGLVYLSRTRALHHDEVNLTYHKQLVTVEELRRTANAKLTILAALTEAAARNLMDVLYPGDEKPHWNNNYLFDGYFKTKEEMIQNPKKFRAQHTEGSTANLKRTDKTRNAEIERVNNTIEAKQDEINATLVMVVMSNITKVIDDEIARHNKEVKDRLKKWVLDDGINEDWIVDNLYTEEQKAIHAMNNEQEKALYERIKALQAEHADVTQQKNRRRRSVFQKAVLEWTANIPELHTYVEELDIEKAHDRQLTFLTL